MAKAQQKVKKSLLVFHKLFAAIALLAFVVVIVSAMRANVQVITMAYRSAVVMLLVGLVGRVVIRLLATYEEMNGGER